MSGHADRDHAPFSPSAAERWLNCCAAVPLEELCRAAGAEDEDSPAAKAGTIGHEMAERHLRMHDYDMDQDTSADENDHFSLLALGADPNEYREGVKVYLRHIRELRRSVGEAAITSGFAQGGADAIIEGRVQVAGKECWGSIDFALVEALGTLHVVDLKMGSGKLVSPVENVQLLTYAAGLVETYGPNFDRVVLHIVQPRVQGQGVEPIQTWETTVDRCKAHLKAVKAAIKAGRATGAADRGTSGAWCGWCKGQAICKAKRSQALSVLDDLPAVAAESPIDRIPAASPEVLGQILMKADEIRAFLDAVEKHCLQNPPPQYKLVEGNTKTRWVQDEMKVAAGLLKLGIDPYRKTLIGITDAKKIAGKARAAEIEALTEKPKGKPTLALLDDPRPRLGSAMDALKAQDVLE